MSLQSNKRSQTKSSSARRKDIYKKSKYYQEKRQKLLIATGIGIFVLVFILILAGIRGCNNYMSSRQAAAKKTVSMNASKDNSQKASSDSQNTDSSNATVSSPVSLTLSVVGDCTLGTDETFDYDTSLNAYYENYGADYFLQNVKDIFSADDLTIANFEGTLTDSDEREDKTFAFKAPASYASILTGGSVEAVNTANNHSHDYGEQSFNDTLAALDDAGIVHFGYDETAVMDVKGIKVGLVGIYELYDHLEREQQLKDNIAKVKADGAQLIVVIFHWGNETETVPDSNQTTLGRIAIDEGADLVCGHHPHVLQGIETYKGRNIVYSLGNFCFGGNSSPSDMDTMIYQQTFTIDADGVKKDNVTNIIPCSISSAAYDGYNNYQPTPAEGDEATRILGKINERSSWISTAEGSTFTAKYNSNNDSQSRSADTAASDSDIVDMNSSASDDTDAETYDESYDTDNSDAE
ncbi:CapA family protein [Ruminococcus sp. AM29-12LB]|nr:CapA family protein [Ruminococcus sp. AM29-12LB]